MTLDAPLLPDAARTPRRRGGALDLARFGADPLRFLDRLRADERDLVPFRLGRFRCRLVASPAAISDVLESEDWPPLSRGRLSALDLWYSGGLILTEGTEHHRQRDVLWRPLVADPRLLDGGEARPAARRRMDCRGALELLAELRALCRAIDWETLARGSTWTGRRSCSPTTSAASTRSSGCSGRSGARAGTRRCRRARAHARRGGGSTPSSTGSSARSASGPARAARCSRSSSVSPREAPPTTA